MLRCCMNRTTPQAPKAHHAKVFFPPDTGGSNVLKRTFSNSTLTFLNEPHLQTDEQFIPQEVLLKSYKTLSKLNLKRSKTKEINSKKDEQFDFSEPPLDLEDAILTYINLEGLQTVDIKFLFLICDSKLPIDQCVTLLMNTLNQ